jgi:tRNA pseudouridine55 synthase
MPDTLILIDKPVGFSSFQVVRLLKKFYDKVGHAGTLDPFASGLLIMLTNHATKQFDSIQKLEKEYYGEIFLGLTTDTYDITGARTEPQKPIQDLTLDDLEKVTRRFVGEIEQVPPRFSALKHQGKKLYELSRKDHRIEIDARKVTVKSFDILDIDVPILRFRSVVGKGVYIRSLAHDIGEMLGCGAILVSLRRTRIGNYNVTQAITLGHILHRSC